MDQVANDIVEYLFNEKVNFEHHNEIMNETNIGAARKSMVSRKPIYCAIRLPIGAAIIRAIRCMLLVLAKNFLDNFSCFIFFSVS